MILKGKNIVLAITGSIAAYKSALVVRLLKKAGANVRVVCTKDALEFVTPLTLATLSEGRVYSDFTEDEDQGTWTNHVEMGLWGDLFLVAPLSANTLAKMANGICDNFLMATYLSAKCPTAFAPAMDLDMYAHPTTQENIKKLTDRGHVLIDSESGFLASGLSGKGRMAEPENIVESVASFFQLKAPFNDKNVLITAGPTYEPIDAVRFIGNYSSGKMGYEIANRFAELGAKVTLVSGPSSQEIHHPNVKLIRVKTSKEMYDACHEHFAIANITIKSAAVADYRPKNVLDHKMKKSEKELSIELERTDDILGSLGNIKRADQLLIGFALETNDEVAYAKGKIERKNLDMIVLNSLRDAGAGFGHDTNKVTFIDKDNKMASFELKSKREVAVDLSNKILELCGNI
ncbi:MAG: bifunctional phosphopantothenoylcysteine decarboxylase/phosphopantothenate--cysteine ligase CoaBC [Bacteroidota bacterium]